MSESKTTNFIIIEKPRPRGGIHRGANDDRDGRVLALQLKQYGLADGLYTLLEGLDNSATLPFSESRPQEGGELETATDSQSSH